MLDTIRLTFQGIKPEALISQKDGERWTFNTTEDGEIERQRTIQRLNVSEDKKTYNGTLAIMYEYKKSYLNVEVSSLPALIHGTSFEVLTTEDLKRLTHVLEERVHPYVDVDINTGIFTRLDNSLLYSMERSPGTYISLLDELTRDSQYRMKKTLYQHETIQFHNKQMTLGFYDKFQKNRHNAVEMRFLQACDNAGKQNALRYEIQNKNAKTIRNTFGQDVTLQDVTKDFFIHRLHEQRKKLFNKHFQFHAGERKATLEDFLNTSIFMKERHTRNVMDKALWYIALEKGFITLDETRKIMELSGFTRQAVYKRMKGFKELLSYDIEKSELYDELKHKIENTFAA